MQQYYEASLPYRLAFGFAFFAVLSLWELKRHGWSSRRLREYRFLLIAMVASVAYASVHDQITATISREYFLYAKSLASDPRPYRVAVAVLAVKASYWVGLVIGTAMLVANNPSPYRPQLADSRLFGLLGWPFVCAVVGAVMIGLLSSHLEFGQRDAAVALGGLGSANRYIAVWCIHLGSYVGGFVGCVVAVFAIVIERRQLRGQPQ